MANETPRTDPTKAEVVYRLPGMEDVAVRRDIEFPAGESGTLHFDLYVPPRRASGPLPLVVFVSGYPDRGFERRVGCRFKEMGACTSWARLVAASGLAALAYTNRTPPADALALLRFLRANGASLGLDAGRIALWACSGNVPTALWLLMQPPREAVRCAALCYGFTLDLTGAAHVAEASSGREENPGLNESLDHFASEALARSLPVTLVNHPTAPHAFDLMDDSETTREILRQLLAFLHRHLAQ